MSDMQNKVKEEEIQKALERFLQKANLMQVEVARIIGTHRSVVATVKQGFRPYAPALARLYILTQDEAFSPKTDLEKVGYEKEKANLPATLKGYLEKGTVPDSEKSDQVESTAQKPEQPVPKASSPKAEVPEGAVESALKIVCALLGTDLADLHRLVQSSLERGKGVNPSTASKVLASPCLDLVLSGAAEIKGQNLGEIRFVLTSGAFKRFEGKFTEQEIEDTKKLIQELRRRLNVSVQLTDLSARAKLGKALAHEIDELYLAIELCKEAIPSGAATRISQTRSTLASILSTQNEGNDHGE